MKILYVGTLHPFGTCYSRFRALRELEPDTHGLDTDVILGWHQIESRVARAFETFTLRGTLDETGDVNELDAGRDDFCGSCNFSQLEQAFFRDSDISHIGFNGTKGIVLCLGSSSFRQCVE